MGRPSAPKVTVTCTNHLSPSQAHAAWEALLRDVLMPVALRTLEPTGLAAAATSGDTDDNGSRKREAGER